MKTGRANPVSIVTMLLISTALPHVADAADTAARAFRHARDYTVRVRTQIDTPFIEDVRGSFQGAGFLVDAKRGWIVTNAHVVGQSPSSVEVAFAGGAYVQARKIYVDSFADIAVVAIDGVDPRHTVAQLSCGEPPSIGEPIGAFGHPLGIPFTGSRGIVSATTDQFGPDLIQIDATVDHGNSGGPVISMNDGRVVGIATSGAGGTRADELNFATPSADVCRILEILRQGGSPTPPRMPFALLRDEDGRHTLKVAQSFEPESWPFEPGDEILGIKGNPAPIADLTDLINALRGHGERLTFRIARGDGEQDLEVFPVRRPTILDRQGLMVDGALIAPSFFEDERALTTRFPLMVHSVEPGSNAEALSIEEYDIVQSIDGQRFDDLAAVTTYLQARPQGEPITMVLRRWKLGQRIFDFHIRELPGTDVKFVGDAEHATAMREE